MKKIYNLTKYQEFYRMNKTYKKILSGFLQTSYNTVHNWSNSTMDVLIYSKKKKIKKKK